MKINSADLTEKEQEEFAEIFYDLADFNDCVDGNPLPWGCPWYCKREIEGNTIREMAQNYFNDHIDEINELQAIEIENLD